MTEYTTGKDWDAGVSINVSRGPNFMDLKPTQHRLRFRGGDGWELTTRWPDQWRWWWNRTIGRLTGLRWWATCPTLAEFEAAIAAAVDGMRSFRDQRPRHVLVVPPGYDEAIEKRAEELWGPDWREAHPEEDA